MYLNPSGEGNTSARAGDCRKIRNLCGRSCRQIMFAEWLKDLWKEAWGRGLFLIGFGSNVITFFLPGLQAQVLRGIGIALLFAGFVWANFNVYKKHRISIGRFQQEIAKKDAALRERNFKISLTFDGWIPTQAIKLKASEVVTVSRLGYLLSDGTSIVTEDLSLKGEAVDVPLNTGNLSKIFNTSRPDMASWDRSGPMKFEFTISIGGATRNFVLPARIENVIGAGYKITGSAEFGKS